MRHAHHDRLGRVLCGRMPGVSLSEQGRAQAHVLAARFETLRSARVLASPQARAQETAAPVGDAAGVPVETAPELDVIDFGDWTGRSFDSLADDPL